MVFHLGLELRNRSSWRRTFISGYEPIVHSDPTKLSALLKTLLDSQSLTKMFSFLDLPKYHYLDKLFRHTIMHFWCGWCTRSSLYRVFIANARDRVVYYRASSTWRQLSDNGGTDSRAWSCDDGYFSKQSLRGYFEDLSWVERWRGRVVL